MSRFDETTSTHGQDVHEVPGNPKLSKRSFWRSAMWTIGLWVLLFFLTLATKIAAIAFAALAMTGALPFILAVFWLSLSPAGAKFREWLDSWHNRLFSAALLFCYGAYAHKWAGDVINEIFNVDPRFFGVTSAVLAVFFTPFGVVYRPDVLSNVFTVFLVALMAVAPILVFSLIFASGWKVALKRALWGSLAIVACSAFLGVAIRMSAGFKPVVKRFAVWADFNEHYLCTDGWKSQPDSVVFLDNGEVLGYFPSNKEYTFKVLPCNNQKTY